MIGGRISKYLAEICLLDQPFVKSPDNISVELLQKGKSLPVKTPWSKMENFGEW